jgi:putative tryptophan/tyrosine transport system substrate-binding protein
MASHIERRKFLATLGGAAAGWPLAAGAQQAAMPVVGILGTAPTTIEERRMNAFRLGLGESGYAEGQNVRFEYRLAEGRYDRMSMLAVDLVNRQVSVIVALGSSVAANAAKAATATIPIVFAIADDPVHA